MGCCTPLFQPPLPHNYYWRQSQCPGYMQCSTLLLLFILTFLSQTPSTVKYNMETGKKVRAVLVQGLSGQTVITS